MSLSICETLDHLQQISALNCLKTVCTLNFNLRKNSKQPLEKSSNRKLRLSAVSPVVKAEKIIKIAALFKCQQCR